MTREPIAIVGLGALYPGARTPREFWENVLARRREFRPIPDCRLSHDYMDADPAAPDKTYATRAAVIDGFTFNWIERRVPRSTFESTDIVHWLALEVALAALADAGYTRERLPSKTTGVIVGNTLTGEQMRSQALRARWPFVKRALAAALAAHGLSPRDAEAIAATAERTMKSALAPTTEDTLAGGLSNTIAGRICTALGVHGGGYTVDGACSSSLLAVATAATALERGEWDVALAGGVDVSIDPFELVSFAKTGALAAGDMNVYDRRASGFIPGEGCGFVVLRRLADARAASDRVYAVLHGWGISSDGRGGITAPDREGQALAIERAYARAGYSAGTLSFVEGHGTGTVVGDRTEILGLETVLRRAGVAARRIVGITSLKSIVGHTKAAAGVGGLIKASLAVNRRVIPATAGCTDPNTAFDSDVQSVYPILQGEVCPADSTLRAGISAMGFGGINCHVTVESADPPDDRVAPAVSERSLLASSQTTELFVLAADDPTGLLAEADRLTDAARGASLGDLVDLSSMMAAREMRGNARAAVIAATPEDLAERLHELREIIAAAESAVHAVAWTPTRRVWAGLGARRARVGFLFPGQGSQAIGMARRLVERHPWAANWLDAADRWLDREGQSLRAIMFPPLDRAASPQELAEWRKRLAATENAQPAICLSSVLWLRRLRDLGVAPDAVGGHSLGELTAFHAAGAFDEPTLVGLAALRGDAMAAPPDSAGTMLSVRCDRARAELLAARARGYVVVANINSPSQIVLSGEKGAIGEVERAAAAEGIVATRLPVSNAFHSQLVEGASRILRDRARLPDSFEMHAQLFSGVAGTVVTRSLPLREHFVQQLTAPVDFVSLVRDMSASVDLLLEVGPGGVLSSLVRETVGEWPPCMAVESQPGRDADLNTALAALHAAGVRVAWNRLYDDRLVRPFRAASTRVFIENPCELPMHVPDDVRPIVSAEYSRLESTIAAETGLSAERLSRYFEQRTPFLASIVRADVESLATIRDLADSPEKRAAATSTSAPSPERAEAPTETVGQIAGLVADLIARRTGYPRASIQPALRLSQDLALDSIKASEIVAEAARQLGLAGKIEPGAFLGSRIDQIAEALHDQRSTRSAPVEPDSWVRDFVIERWAEELPPTDAGASLRSARAWVAAGPAEQPIADAIRGALERAGARVTIPTPSSADVWTHCVVVLPKDVDLHASPAERLRTMVTRIGIDVLRDASCVAEPRTVAFVQFGGGHFGAYEAPAEPDVTCASAFAASLHLERPAWRVRAIDFSPNTGAGYIAEAVVAELETAGAWSVAGYDAELRRRVPRPRLLDTAALPARDLTWRSDEVMLVTGGGRGITAECAFALARETGLRTVLVGRTARPDVASTGAGLEVAQTLKRFDDEGMPATYLSVDVTDRAAVAALVADIRANIGPIALVVHGSAQNVPRRIEHVSPEDAFEEVSPKVLGAMHLLDALRDAPPKLIVALTSAIGVSGMPGNAWYGFSNEVVAVLLDRYAADQPDTATLAVAFSVWKDIGMGARLGSISTLANMGVSAVPRADGVAHFLRLIERRPRSHQVVVAARLALDTWRPRKPPVPPASHFLQTVVQHEPDVEVVARTHLHPSRDPYLVDHVFRGAYLFPTVFGLEAMAQAVALAVGTMPDNFAIEAVALPRPIVVDPERGTTIEVRAQVLDGDAEGRPRVAAEVRTESTGFERAHFSAHFVFGTDAMPADPKRVDVAQKRVDVDPNRDLYGRLLFQGERFQRLGSFRRIDAAGCVFELRPGADLDAQGRFTDAEVGPLLLGDPYARDALLQSTQTSVPNEVCLPVRIDRIEFFGAPRRAAFGQFEMLRREADDLIGAVQAIDETGHTIEQMRGYVVHILEQRSDGPGFGALTETSLEDEQQLASAVGRWIEGSRAGAVSIALEHVAGLGTLSREERHERERHVVERAVKNALASIRTGTTDGVLIDWLESGRPIVHGVDGCNVSLTHDLDTCVVVAGPGRQGCDLASIDQRSRSKWLALLGEIRGAILDGLLAGGESLDTAATRVWAAAEAARKASGAAALDLAVHERRNGSVLFRCAASGQEFHVLTTTVRVRGRHRIWAVVIEYGEPPTSSP